MPTPKLLIVDVNLAKRLCTELGYRGRPARWAGSIVDRNLLDPEMLASLAAALDQPWALITYDDAMPNEHGDVISRLAVTVATIRPWNDVDTGLEQEEYKREVVHRWAHSMAEQAEGTVRRYGLTAHRPWTPRRR